MGAAYLLFQIQCSVENLGLLLEHGSPAQAPGFPDVYSQVQSGLAGKFSSQRPRAHANWSVVTGNPCPSQ